MSKRVEHANTIIVLANQAFVKVVNDGLELKFKFLVVQEFVKKKPAIFPCTYSEAKDH